MFGNVQKAVLGAVNAVKSFGQTPVFNILLLGETGTGKSTTINAWANYMRYETFDEAKKGDFEQIIPAKFKLPDPVTAQPTFEVNCGTQNKNEIFEKPGESCTQLPSSYLFKFKNKVIRIIDTPGIGDTRGTVKDDENIDQILAFLHNYTELHAIIILFKATQTRSTSNFCHCISELLTHLHKSASKNLIFCFTFSQSTHFRPGDGYTTVKEYFRTDLSEVEMKLMPGENCFFIDNDSFRFLVAQKQNYPYERKQESGFRESWEKSALQSKKMWERITKEVPPHKLGETISLNNARKFILQMAEPLVRLQTVIEVNIGHMETQQELLKACIQNKSQLEKELLFEVDYLESKPLDYPRTVCTERKCIEIIDYQGDVQVNYKTLCHKHCYLDDVGVNHPGHHLLRNCAAIGPNGICKYCDCNWEKHQHITLEFIKVKKSLFSYETESQIKSADTNIDSYKFAIKSMKEMIDRYNYEYETIQDICVKFALILAIHSTTAFNKFLEPYLDRQISEEEEKIESILNYSDKALKSLKKMKETHQEKVEILKRAIDTNEEEMVQLEDLYLFKQQLLDLEYSGAQLEQMLNAAEWSKRIEIEHIEEKCLDLTETQLNADNEQREPIWKQFWAFSE